MKERKIAKMTQGFGLNNQADWWDLSQKWRGGGGQDNKVNFKLIECKNAMEQPRGRAGRQLDPQVWSSGVMGYLEILNLSGWFMLQPG